MKLVTFRTYDRIIHAGVVQEERVITLEYPTMLELLRDPAGLTKARRALQEPGEEHTLNEVILLPPIPDPPSVRDFYAFEQHVKSARALRGLGMIPEWYEFPIFYFTNNSEIFGHEQPVPYPTGSKELDFELEIACVIGREGKDIPVEEAANYIAGYTIMNDWSARDLQRRDMKLNLGPGKGKDFATSLGPWLVTPDELASHRNGSGVSERYDLTMLARVNGREISRGNFRDIHYSFPQMIAWASQNARLRAGDVLGSGTVGTGCLMELQNIELGTQVQPWLQPGDLVELEIEGIGVLRNTIL
jgi:fumarylacetoacetate (FAA) hydrolase